MISSSKSLTNAYRQHGEDLNSSAELVELRHMRNIQADCLFYNSIRASLPSSANNFESTTPVAFLNRNELYLPAIQLFSDIQKTDFSNIQNILDVLVTSGVECCIFAEGDKQLKSYLDMKHVIFNNMKSVYDVAIRHDGLIRMDSHEKRKRMLNLHLSFELGVCAEGAFVQTKFTVPTFYKSFPISIYELNGKFYVSVPKESTEVGHPENETFIFESASPQADIATLVRHRYRHRIFYSTFKRHFDKYYEDDIQFEGIDIWSTVQLMDAMKI
jgi:hypothetical protein